MHYFADILQAGPFARTYMLEYEQMMRKKSIKSRKYRGHSPSKRQNILIFHQNPLQHPISSLSACHVIIYCAKVHQNCPTCMFWSRACFQTQDDQTQDGGFTAIGGSQGRKVIIEDGVEMITQLLAQKAFINCGKCWQYADWAVVFLQGRGYLF